MKSTFTINVHRTVCICIVAGAQLSIDLPAALAEDKLSQPVLRVANETPAAQQATTAQPVANATTAPAAQAGPRAPLDFTAKNGEHQLMPVIRALKASQEEIDRNIRDYSCTFIKQERINGELADQQHIFMKVMHQPFSVYMSFIKPHGGREVVYVAGQNEGKLVALETGFTRRLGKIRLDPNGVRAMNGQKRPITDVGMRNLTAKLMKMWEAETQFAECEVTIKPGTKVEGRPATMVQVKHPLPRSNFKFNYARLFFDDELRIPVHFDAYVWPAKENAEPQLEERYTYANLKINNNITARDFDPNNNPEIFKP